MAAVYTLEALIARLEAQQGALAEQLAGLREPVANRSHAVLLQYVLAGSGDVAAKWAAAQGWRLPSATGTRAWVSADVLALLHSAPEPLPPGLLKLAIQGFEGNSKAVRKRYD